MSHALREITSEAASFSEGLLRRRIQEGGFALALSGGGHRATLATLGALLAIVDRGLASKIIQIASVSEGSITNAFVAQRTEVEGLKPEELDPIRYSTTPIADAARSSNQIRFRVTWYSVASRRRHLEQFGLPGPARRSVYRESCGMGQGPGSALWSGA